MQGWIAERETDDCGAGNGVDRMGTDRGGRWRAGCAATASSHGGGRLQERPDPQGDSRRPIHGYHGVLLRLAGTQLHGLPRWGKRRRLGAVRRRHPTEADGSQNDADGQQHQSDELRRTAGRDVQYVSSRHQSAQCDAEPRVVVQQSASSRTGRAVSTSRRSAARRSDSR